MKSIDSQDEFDEFVRTVAANNIERDGSSAKYVAESVITSIQVLNDDTATISTTGGEYSNFRITPTDVLGYTIYEVEKPKQLPNGYRRAAVVLLANEIDEAMKNYRRDDPQEDE